MGAYPKRFGLARYAPYAVAAASSAYRRYGGGAPSRRFPSRGLKMRGRLSRSNPVTFTRRRRRFHKRKVSGRIKRKMMFKKGMRKHTISKTYVVKNIQQCQVRFTYNSQNYNALTADMSSLVDDHRNFIGNATENYYTWQESQDYKKFVLKSITTKIDKFAIKRIIANDVTMKGSPPQVHYFEDKEDIQDPLIYFYRQADGQDFPTVMKDPTKGGHALELMKKKCIRGCKDGFYWILSLY